MRRFGITLLSICLFISVASAQKKLLDKIVAVVGNSIILKSDIETQYTSYLVNNGQPNPDIKCQITVNLVSQKLLAAQAVIDSIMVKEDEVDNEVDRRWRNMVQRAGGEDKVEAFLGRSGLQYKDDIRGDVKELLTAERMRAKITEKINTTPQDVDKFYKAIAKDSIPTINKEVEVAEIEIDPKLNKEEKAAYRQKAEDLLARVKKGEDFGTLATLYSQDPGSAPLGGDLGFQDRNGVVKEFAAMAFKLKTGDVSPVFESEFGFHFLQVIERRGEQVHTRHILITPKITSESIDRAALKADTVYNAVIKAKKGSDVFASAAVFYSDNKETKFNGGMMLNQDNVQVRTTLIPTNRLDPQVALVIDTMKVGQISKPQLVIDNTGKRSYKIFYLKTVIDAHKANLAQDFPRIKDAANEAKIARTMSEWFDKRRKETYIKIDPEYQSCPQLKGWATPVSAQVNNP
jgi:peptidyl-prolyl cis-trans isomerase SurA